MLHIVHLEDDSPLQELLQISLQAANPRLILKQFIDSDEMFAYTVSHLQDIDLFILDVRVLGSMSGVEVAQKIRQLNETIPIIITSAYQKPAAHLNALLNCRWYPKPWHIIEITRETLAIAQASSKSKSKALNSLSEIELIMPGLARRSIDKGQIIVFSMTDHSATHVETFFDNVSKVQLAWLGDKPYLGLYDFSQNLGIQLTSEFRRRALELVHIRPDLMRRHAFALPPTTSHSLQPMLAFIRNELMKSELRYQVAIFQDGKSALNWLRSDQ